MLIIAHSRLISYCRGRAALGIYHVGGLGFITNSGFLSDLFISIWGVPIHICVRVLENIGILVINDFVIISFSSKTDSVIKY